MDQGADYKNAARLIKSRPTVSLKILMTEVLLQILSLPDRRIPGLPVPAFVKNLFRKGLSPSPLKNTDTGVPSR